MMWSADDTMGHAALNAVWALVVELRAGLPEIQAAAGDGDTKKINRCLDVLVGKAAGHGLHVRRRWPHLAEQIRSAAESLRRNINDQDAWQALMEIADELEAAIGLGSRRSTSAQWET